APEGAGGAPKTILLACRASSHLRGPGDWPSILHGLAACAVAFGLFRDHLAAPAQPSRGTTLGRRSVRPGLGGDPAQVGKERFAREPDLVRAIAVVADRIALAGAGAAGVGDLDVGQVLLEVADLLVHRHAQELAAITDLDPADRARLI